MKPDEPNRKSSPGLAMLITVVLLALAVQDQFSSGSIDRELLWLLGGLALFWAGQGIDRIFPWR